MNNLANTSFTADATKVKHIGKEDISGKGTEIRKDAEVFAADAGKEIDRLAAQARDGTHKVDQKLEAYRQRADQSIDQTIKKTGTELNKAVDSFDKNVGEVSLVALPSCMAHSLTTICRALRRPRTASLAGSALESRVGIGCRRTQSRDVMIWIPTN